MLMDRFATPSECWQQAALCRARANAAADERLRAAWISIDADLDEARCTQGTDSALEYFRELIVAPLQKTKSRLEVHAPQCARCKALMKVRILIPGRKVDDVAYRCEKCGSEVLRSVPRAW